MIRGGIKKLSDDKNSPEMNDSGVDLITRKNPDEKYYFFVEKFLFQNLEKTLFFTHLCDLVSPTSFLDIELMFDKNL